MTAGPAPNSGALRAVRGCVLAAAAAVLAVTAHAAGGGGTPSGGLTVLLTAAVAGFGIVLADRQRGPVWLLAVLAGSQLAMHVLLDGLDHRHGTAAAAGWAMLFAHAAATVLTALVLARAESAVFVLASVLRGIAPIAIPRWMPGTDVTGPRCAAPSVPPRLVERRVLLCRVVGRRGPPLPA